MPWPDEYELQAFLQRSGLFGNPPTALQEAIDLESLLETAIERWNDLTGYHPFMSDGDVNEYRDFETPLSGLLDFDSGLLTLTSLTTGNEYLAQDSLTGGLEEVNVRDFLLCPTDAPQKSKPWTYAKTGTWGTGYGIIRVTGEWGYCRSATLPEAARQAVMALAAKMIAPQFEAFRRQGGLTRLTRGDETKQWGDSIGESEKVWDGLISLALMQYARVRVA